MQNKSNQLVLLQQLRQTQVIKTIKRSRQQAEFIIKHSPAGTYRIIENAKISHSHEKSKINNTSNFQKSIEDMSQKELMHLINSTNDKKLLTELSQHELSSVKTRAIEKIKELI